MDVYNNVRRKNPLFFFGGGGGGGRVPLALGGPQLRIPRPHRQMNDEREHENSNTLLLGFTHLDEPAGSAGDTYDGKLSAFTTWQAKGILKATISWEQVVQPPAFTTIETRVSQGAAAPTELAADPRTQATALFHNQEEPALTRGYAGATTDDPQPVHATADEDAGPAIPRLTGEPIHSDTPESVPTDPQPQSETQPPHRRDAYPKFHPRSPLPRLPNRVNIRQACSCPCLSITSSCCPKAAPKAKSPKPTASGSSTPARVKTPSHGQPPAPIAASLAKAKVPSRIVSATKPATKPAVSKPTTTTATATKSAAAPRTTKPPFQRRPLPRFRPFRNQLLPLPAKHLYLLVPDLPPPNLASEPVKLSRPVLLAATTAAVATAAVALSDVAPTSEDTEPAKDVEGTTTEESPAPVDDVVVELLRRRNRCRGHSRGGTDEAVEEPVAEIADEVVEEEQVPEIVEEIPEVLEESVEVAEEQAVEEPVVEADQSVAEADNESAGTPIEDLGENGIVSGVVVHSTEEEEAKPEVAVEEVVEQLEVEAKEETTPLVEADEVKEEVAPVVAAVEETKEVAPLSRDHRVLIKSQPACSYLSFYSLSILRNFELLYPSGNVVLLVHRVFF
ncbi:hypothetical protein RHS01_06371 [Rhizoctonia solani]|uniref:Uncharacterized protein n=1 Tax=Rhizoctonia solani TaxID=456999 RepID=A0A8H7M492_9AGAM|nr:hypothetical protein RHS01_06371 [Rhizoctonia solani]